MAKVSPAQQKIVDRIKAGGRVVLDDKTGRYLMFDGGKARMLNTRPIEVMLRTGVLVKGMSSHCQLTDDQT
jgi:hypothetical protein